MTGRLVRDTKAPGDLLLGFPASRGSREAHPRRLSGHQVGRSDRRRLCRRIRWRRGGQEAGG